MTVTVKRVLAFLNVINVLNLRPEIAETMLKIVDCGQPRKVVGTSTQERVHHYLRLLLCLGSDALPFLFDLHFLTVGAQWRERRGQRTSRKKRLTTSKLSTGVGRHSMTQHFGSSACHGPSHNLALAIH